MLRIGLALAALFLCTAVAPASAQRSPLDVRSPMPCGPQTSGLGELHGDCIVLKVFTPGFPIDPSEVTPYDVPGISCPGGTITVEVTAGKWSRKLTVTADSRGYWIAHFEVPLLSRQDVRTNVHVDYCPPVVYYTTRFKVLPGS